jgi:sensor histidine kinase regulating citrate/malate metabolism
MADISISADKTSRKATGSNRLWLRIGGLLVFVIGAVLVLTSFLNYSNYRKTYAELNLTRYLVVAKDARQGIVSGLNIGLHPFEDQYLLPALADLARRYDGIRYIGVIDESGRTISPGEFPSQPAQHWKDKINATASNAYWQSSDADTFQIGLPFMNNFNLKAGAVVIGYDRKRIEAAIDNMMRNMCVDALKVLALLTVLTLAGVYFFTRKFSTELAQVGAALDKMFHSAEPPLIADHMLGEEVARDINEFTAMSHRVAREITRLEQELLPTVNPALPDPEGKA